MLLTSVSDVALNDDCAGRHKYGTAIYCAWGLSMAKSIPGTVDRMSFRSTVGLLHADDCTPVTVLAAEVSDKLLLRCW